MGRANENMSFIKCNVFSCFKTCFFIIKYKNVRNLKVIVFDLNIFVVLVAFIIFQSYCGLGFVLFSDTTLPLIIGCFVLS